MGRGDVDQRGRVATCEVTLVVRDVGQMAV